MKVMHNIVLASFLFLGTAFATANDNVQNISPAKTAANAQMTSQQELIDLFMAAAKTGNQEVIQEFLKNGFPVDVKNKAGYTALMMAAYYGHQATVTTLLEYGADRCARDAKGNTAIMGAMFKLEWGIVKQLRKADCDVVAKQTGQKTTEQFAEVIGQSEKLKKLID